MKYVMAFMFLVVTAGIPVLAYDLTREGKSAPQIAPQPPAIRLTMLGDSIIAMMAPQQPSLPPPVNSAVNLGVGGQDTTSIKKQVASIPATTTHVLLEGGINNYFSRHVRLNSHRLCRNARRYSGVDAGRRPWHYSSRRIRLQR